MDDYVVIEIAPSACSPPGHEREPFLGDVARDKYCTADARIHSDTCLGCALLHARQTAAAACNCMQHAHITGRRIHEHSKDLAWCKSYGF